MNPHVKLMYEFNYVKLALNLIKITSIDVYGWIKEVAWRKKITALFFFALFSLFFSISFYFFILITINVVY